MAAAGRFVHGARAARSDAAACVRFGRLLDFVNGVSRASGWEFALVNTLVGVLLVALAWFGAPPGVGTIVQTGSSARRCRSVCGDGAAVVAARALPAAGVALPVWPSASRATSTPPPGRTGRGRRAQRRPADPVPWGYNALQGVGALGLAVRRRRRRRDVRSSCGAGSAVDLLRARLPRGSSPPRASEPSGLLQPASSRVAVPRSWSSGLVTPVVLRSEARAATAAYLRSGRSGSCFCRRCTSVKPASDRCRVKRRRASGTR
jgi:hypothetical protein